MHIRDREPTGNNAGFEALCSLMNAGAGAISLVGFGALAAAEEAVLHEAIRETEESQVTTAEGPGMIAIGASVAVVVITVAVFLSRKMPMKPTTEVGDAKVVSAATTSSPTHTKKKPSRPNATERAAAKAAAAKAAAEELAAEQEAKAKAKAEAKAAADAAKAAADAAAEAAYEAQMAQAAAKAKEELARAAKEREAAKAAAKAEVTKAAAAKVEAAKKAAEEMAATKAAASTSASASEAYPISDASAKKAATSKGKATVSPKAGKGAKDPAAEAEKKAEKARDELNKAIKNNDVRKVQVALDTGLVGVEYVEPDTGHTAMHRAAAFGAVKVSQPHERARCTQCLVP